MRGEEGAFLPSHPLPHPLAVFFPAYICSRRPHDLIACNRLGRCVVIRYGSLEITCKKQNRSFVSNKYVSQALFQTLQRPKMNFEQL